METAFQSWINARIDESGLTKRELAKLAGISASLVYAVTTEGRKPSPSFCVHVAAALGIPTVEVLHRAGFPVVPPVPPEDAERDQLVRALDELPPTVRVSLVTLVEALTGG